MTTTVETNKVTFTGNGSTTVFPFTFRVFTAADIEVYLDGVLQTLTTHYSVAIDPSVEGGSVTFVTAPASSVAVLIKRVVDFTQPSRFPTEGRLPESTFENAVDRATMLLVQLKEILSRVPALAVTSSFSDLLLPEPSAGKAIGWNDAGTNLSNLTLVQTTVAYSGTISKGTDASKPANPSQGDIYFATDTNTLYKCVVGGAWNAVMEPSKGANIASATTTSIWATDGDFIHITGTTTITGFGTALKAGACRTLVFDGALTLTHHATNLILPGGANITTAAGDRAIVRAETTTTARVIAYIRASGLPVVNPTVSPAFESALLHVEDQQSSGTAGGTFTSGAWQTRTLNTVKTNQISGASVASNQITLPAGTYFISATAPAYLVNAHKLKLRNITDSSDAIIGTSEISDSVSGSQTRSRLCGRITIAAQKVFELQHQCGTTRATNGFGYTSGLSVVEVFSEIQVWKVA